MSNHAQDPRDRIFGTDDVLNQLQKRREDFLRRVAATYGDDAKEALRNDDQAALPAGMGQLREEYLRLASEISRRNSMRCSRQLSRFLSGINEDGSELSEEAMRWWMNRY